MSWYKKCDKRKKTCRSMVIDTKLNIVDFISTVNEIAINYFNVDGSYTPDIGLINAMRVFYNQCVKHSKFDDIGYNVIDPLEMELIISDESFIEAFNNALTSDGYDLDFSNAYREAMEIVDYRKNSVNNTLETVKNAILSILDNITNSMSPENVSQLLELAEQFKGNSDAEMIIDVLNKTSDKIG